MKDTEPENPDAVLSDTLPDTLPESLLAKNVVPIASEPSQPETRAGKAIAAAIKWWLQSQLESVDRLDVRISGSGRQFLGGCVPGISLQANRAVYRGIHLSEVAIAAGTARWEVGRILRGQPLRLLEPIPIAARVRIDRADFNASLKNSTLADVLPEVFLPWLGDRALSFQNCTARFAPGTFALTLPENNPPACLRSSVTCEGQEIRFHHATWQAAPDAPAEPLPDRAIALGDDVLLQHVAIDTESLVIKGRLTVRPPIEENRKR